MKNWREIYKSRIVSAAEAVRHIKSGNRVVVAHASGSPELLLKALVNNKDAYKNVEIVHMVSMGASEYCLPGLEKHFVHNSLFAGATTRKAIHDGRAHFTISHFSQIPRLFTEKILPVDVTMCMVSRPDEHGFCSFGVSVDYTKPAAESSKIVIAEVTPNMPRTLGDAFIHVSEIDYIVECESKPIILQPPKISETDEKIGGYCAELIRDGDCLQLGIGAVPDAILGFLKHKKDLGIHTEMFSDGVVDLVEAGVITCARKNFHPDKMVATFFMGTEKLYKFVHNNPMVQMFPVNITNNPAIIAQNDNMVSINSTLQVDLNGQAASESIGYKQFSGTGGQADFVRGAAWSKGGRSILAFHSTASGGKISRIVTHLDEGAVVTTTRSDIHYVVTEHGIADLRGKSVPERAKALINIAHPDFKGELKKEFQRIYNRKV
ncbi:MAG: acetyl-CoA hydrolase/transferase family protein [Desulfomonilia bacterium]